MLAKSYVFLLYRNRERYRGLDNRWCHHRITTTCVVEVDCMNQFVFNLANVISFKSVLTSNIYLLLRYAPVITFCKYYKRNK